MQRLTSLAARRDLGGLAACAAAAAAGTPRVRSGAPARPGRAARPLCTQPGRRLSRRGVAFAGEDKRRLFCTQGGAAGPGAPGGPPEKPRPPVSVVGIPDPLTWIRCKVQMSLIDLYFGLDMDCEEFHRGIKQALVHVSDKMSRGRFHELHGLLSREMIEYVESKCSPLSAAQRRQLAVKMDDIIFVLPDEVTVNFDNFGRKFCSIVMRFYLVSAHDGPDDPEGVKIFRVAPPLPHQQDAGSPQKRISTAVYEFHREVTRGAPDDWTVTTVWHYNWTLGNPKREEEP